MADIVLIIAIPIVGLAALDCLSKMYGKTLGLASLLSWIDGKNVHTLTNYFISGIVARQIYNKTVNYFARNSSKLKLVKAKLDDLCTHSVTVKCKSLDGETIFTF